MKFEITNYSLGHTPCKTQTTVKKFLFCPAILYSISHEFAVHYADSSTMDLPPSRITTPARVGPHPFQRKNTSPTSQLLPSFTNGSDHRMLRANVHINAKQAKFEQVKRKKPPRRVLDPTAALLATENLDSCEDQDIDKEYDTLVHALKKAQDAAVTIPTHHSRID
ncbi:hypothetical protein CRE_23006 [Caenorhabditis remanei]|uniref:Uncharacterized protein n=1 Tax=Caenorhabditis remanei TaxID=31234 RepID=E3N4G0_CAERE|nr:hypothetical protein CRE_23006 [Caenorhabditis remanei]